MSRRALLRRGRSAPAVRHQAAPFAEDLLQACEQAFAVLGDPGADTLLLPITVPFDHSGRVVLSSAPPQPDAPRVPARMEITRQPDGFGVSLSRSDGRAWLVPGVRQASRLGPDPVPLARMTFALTPAGMTVAAWNAAHEEVPLELDETTARALATALLITVGVKLAKAR